MEISSFTDIKDLFRGIAAGDETAFRTLFDRYKTRVYYFVLTVVESQTVAEEVVQEVFMKLWVSRYVLDRVEQPENYLFVVARNRGLDHLRKERGEQDFRKSVASAFDDHDNSTEEQLLFNESRRLLDEAVALLPEQQRNVYLLARGEGLSREAIGLRLGISPHTVKNHLTAALQNIREFLGRNNSLVLFFFLTGVLY